ncbi:hypothetical protein LA080_001525 [Diaporthe eres]|uniref:Uncharacterized protein n=1 Tax=Diaporthe vaccinii TaxID=105482 RepID=A0ABR4EVH6_9PEZI|nr:hypothetical protein LA080_001525 [Diaporthe eres]
MKRLITSLRKAPTPLSSPLPPSPPPTPCPWLWRCHSCYTIYRLAVTRRCLDCDHTFCLGEPASPPKGKKRKRGGPCKAEFDYTGWKAWGSWRRTVLLNGDNKTRIITGSNGQNWGNEHRAATELHGEEARFEDKRERLFLRRRHNCFLHCDFPSECHHSLFRAQQEGRPILREAEALDAAEAAAREEAEAEEREREGKRWTRRRLTVQEYKQRRAERRRRSVSAAVAGRFVEHLSTVTEDDDNDDNVSPCSPTSPDPPGDLMREVSPVEYDEDNEQPLSPSSGRRRSRTSLLMTTDTPVDFATTAAPLSFDDTYSDDEDDDYNDDGEPETHNDERHRAKSRRKIAQLTGEGLESFGPFILDTSGPSPTSPSAANAAHAEDRTGSNLTALDLQAAWSEQAWFSSSTASGQPLSPKSPERAGKKDRMLALLGRRGSGGGPPSPRQPVQEIHQHQQQHHADATAVAGEEWESWSDSSSSPTSSTTSEASLLSSSSTGGHIEVAASGPTVVDDDTDEDGDVPMPDATSQTPSKDVTDEDMGSPMTFTGEHGTTARRDEARDLRALLRMRNAFMRGEMI